MYWSSILYLLTWPLLIVVSYFVVVFTLKKLNLLNSKDTEPVEGKTTE